MSQLWASYYADNVERFRRLLSLTGHSAQAVAVWNANSSGTGSIGGSGSFEEGIISSSSSSYKTRKASGHQAKAGAAGTVGKSAINSVDHAGLTILLRAASSTSDRAGAFVQALLEHPAIDIYVQDAESGWNALHRALYAGNIGIARMLLQKERMDMAGQTLGAPTGRTGQLIKTKDHEGNSPFELYNSTIGERMLEALDDKTKDSGQDSDSDEVAEQQNKAQAGGQSGLGSGEELFFFGSNKNLTLGLGDGDDRQFPERVYLRRPDDLLHRFYEEHLEATARMTTTTTTTSPTDEARHDVADIPVLVQGRPLVIQDVVLSKLHSAVLTTDAVSNLYVCGIGRGGRLGLGDENTRFSFVPVQGPLADKHVAAVALGQNHTMAVTDGGELWTWGSNSSAQLGYTLAGGPSRTDEEAMSAVPRQVFGPLRKERILGVAASGLHSVAHTGSSLYCWGRNVGQLALMDADSRSLDVQAVPRRVAASLFSSAIVAVSAIDRATTCLLANHTVCVFTSYGYNIVKFPFAGGLSGRFEPGRSQIDKIASGGETIAAVTSRGDLFTMSLTGTTSTSTSTSTTNPSKIREALTPARCIWSARKDGVRSVGVGEQGSVIISTYSGAVWRRVRRAKAKGKGGDYKFQRVPFISNVATVRSSAFGAFAAIRCDSAVIQEQIGVAEQTLWDDVAPLHVLQGFEASAGGDTLQFWKTDVLKETLGPIAYEILRSGDLEADLTRHLEVWACHQQTDLGAVVVCSSLAPKLQIPVHSWILTARSSVLREAMTEHRDVPEVCSIETGLESDERTTVVTFADLDLLSLLNMVLYMYEDRVIPVWNYSRQAAPVAHRYRQVRTEVMRLATRLNMGALESAVRIQTEPKRTLDADMRAAMQDSRFFADGDAVVELQDGATARVHSVLMCRRCRWFDGLFHGRSDGRWLAARRAALQPGESVRLDLRHMDAAAFGFVLEQLYADVGTALFDELRAPSLEAFLDVVLAVLAMADELTVDRLAQVCQRVIGRLVDTRSVAQMLNLVGGYAVRQLTDAALEYVCLQMETMLENQLLDELDGRLVAALDRVVRVNQLAQMPFARSGRAEAELLERHPRLAQEMDEERQRRVREMAFRGGGGGGGGGGSGSGGGGGTGKTQTPKTRRNEPFSSVLQPETSQADLMFAMEEVGESVSSPVSRMASQKTIRLSQRRVTTPLSVTSTTTSSTPTTTTTTTPWAPQPAPKQDLRAIMSTESVEWTLVTSSPPAAASQASRTSALSASIDAQRLAATAKMTPAKLSQKERKKQQQQQQQQQMSQTASTRESKGMAWDTSEGRRPSGPWQMEGQSGSGSGSGSGGGGGGGGGGMGAHPPRPESGSPKSPSTTSTHLVPLPKAHIHRAASPDTRFAGQTRSQPTASPSSTTKPMVPHSRVYLRPAPKAEPILGLSMADIIVQQQLEQESMREAVAKRSLQEIQQEQAFQEWWDQESRRAQEEAEGRGGRGEGEREGENTRGTRKTRGGRGGRGPKGKEVRPEDKDRDNARKARPKNRGRGNKA
ncbi:btb/poz-like protein [Grosmannia clavigera kw1407]|uniref:Btb/poz-like protein n=1 Tax=Grosmannia clavigera (strain kw1407 / UAMH 11150) TaxID=655863 RepID=F0XDW8_GROCL|nr:btb/poz-like protein [Grosmannia clavigera kw1407]EFX04249.1 btb/poz-like protein [Grosmannia clavigera kw1407]